MFVVWCEDVAAATLEVVAEYTVFAGTSLAEVVEVVKLAEVDAPFELVLGAPYLFVQPASAHSAAAYLEALEVEWGLVVEVYHPSLKEYQGTFVQQAPDALAYLEE